MRRTSVQPQTPLLTRSSKTCQWNELRCQVWPPQSMRPAWPCTRTFKTSPSRTFNALWLQRPRSTPSATIRTHAPRATLPSQPGRPLHARKETGVGHQGEPSSLLNRTSERVPAKRSLGEAFSLSCRRERGDGALPPDPAKSDVVPPPESRPRSTGDRHQQEGSLTKVRSVCYMLS